MPAFDFRCDQCGKVFEKIVARYGDLPACPFCGGSIRCLDFTSRPPVWRWGKDKS